MENFITVFNNREKALIIWVVIVVAFLLFNKSFRPSILSLLKLLFASKITIGLLIMLAYISLIVFAAYSLRLWDMSLLGDTIMWVLGTAVIMFINYDKATKEKKYFKKVLLDNIKFVVLLEFIINVYVFNFVIEFLLVPVFAFIGALLGFIGKKKEYAPIKNILQFLLGAYVLYLIIFALVHMVSDFKGFATLYNLKDFLLSPLLTILFLPFIYFLALYATYESLFTRIDIFFREQNKELSRFTKRQILRTCLFNLKKLNKFSTDYTPHLPTIKNKADVVHITHQFKMSIRCKK